MKVCTYCGHPPHTCVESPSKEWTGRGSDEERAMQATVASTAVARAYRNMLEKVTVLTKDELDEMARKAVAAEFRKWAEKPS